MATTISLQELKDLVKVSLGTPETVNFNALHKLLLGLINHIATLYSKGPKDKSLEPPVKFRGKQKSTSETPSRKTISNDKDTISRQASSTDEHDRRQKKMSSPRRLTATSLEKRKRKTTSLQHDDSTDENGSAKENGEKKPSQSGASSSGKHKDSVKEKPAPVSQKTSQSSSTSSSAGALDKGSRKTSLKTEKKSSIKIVKSTSKTEAQIDAPTEKEVEEGGPKEEEKDKEPEKQPEEEKVEDKPSSPEPEPKPEPEPEPEPEVVADTAEARANVSEEMQETGPDVTEDTSSHVPEIEESQEKEKEEEDEKQRSDETDLQLSLEPEDRIKRQDLDDILKRIVFLEQEVSKLRSVNQSKAGPLYATESDLEKLERKEKFLQKHIEMVEKESMERQDSLLKELKEAQAQLQYLPNPKELHKSFFISWKMLEDALCAHPTLKENINEVKELAEKGSGLASSKQLSRFLGASGPSDRLLDALLILSRVIEQGRKDGMDQLVQEVADSKASTSSRKGSQRYPVEGKAYMKTVFTSEEGSVEQSESGHTDQTHTEAKESMTKFDAAFASIAPSDAGYVNFKMAKLAEETGGIRKELDEMQLWKDKLIAVQDDIKELANILIRLRADIESKEEKDHDILGNLQMDMNELHTELCGLETRKTMLTRKAEMDSIKQNVEETRYTTLGDVVIDREARIRTQQLQLQLNSVHHMVAEIESRLPDQPVYSPAPMGMPEEIQHPWGTGRTGVGTVIRSGGGISGGGVINPSPPLKPTTDARPSPVGGGGSDEKESGKAETGKPESRKQEVGKQEGEKHEADSPRQYMQEIDEKIRTQFAITRLNQSQINMEARLEACQNQQVTEIRRIQDLMTRMHREYMIRNEDIQDQLSSLLGEEKMQESEGSEHSGQRTPEHHDIVGEVPLTNRVEAAIPRLSEEAALPPVRGPGKATGDQQRAHSMGQCALSADMLVGLRKELLAYIKALRRRIANMEANMPLMSDVDPALIKKPILHRFQCLSCDKRVDLTQPRPDDGIPLSSVVPELPRLPILTSPPRIRNASRNQNVRTRPLDAYEIPRQCGGSYTVSNRPRRLHYYSNLGDVIDVPSGPVFVEKVDVKGTDGHIYKGQVKRANYKSPNIPLSSQAKDSIPPID